MRPGGQTFRTKEYGENQQSTQFLDLNGSAASSNSIRRVFFECSFSSPTHHSTPCCCPPIGGPMDAVMYSPPPPRFRVFSHPSVMYYFSRRCCVFRTTRNASLRPPRCPQYTYGPPVNKDVFMRIRRLVGCFRCSSIPIGAEHRSSPAFSSAARRGMWAEQESLSE